MASSIANLFRDCQSSRRFPKWLDLHDLRHCASLSIASGLGVKTMSTLVRHASPSIVLNVCRHLPPDRDETARP